MFKLLVISFSPLCPPSDPFGFKRILPNSKFIEIESLFVEIVNSYVSQGIDKTMNKFNT